MPLDSQQKSVWPTFLWVLLGFCVFGLLAVIGVRSLGGSDKEYDVTRAKERLENREKIYAEAKTEMTTYAWADQVKGTMKIPVTRAMEIVVKELGAKPVAASGIPVVPPAAPADAPPASTAPEPAAPDSTLPAAPTPPAPPAATPAA